MKTILPLITLLIISSCAYKYSYTKVRIEFNKGKPSIQREGPTYPLKDTVMFGYIINKY